MKNVTKLVEKYFLIQCEQHLFSNIFLSRLFLYKKYHFL